MLIKENLVSKEIYTYRLAYSPSWKLRKNFWELFFLGALLFHRQIIDLTSALLAYLVELGLLPKGLVAASLQVSFGFFQWLFKQSNFLVLLILVGGLVLIFAVISGIKRLFFYKTVTLEEMNSSSFKLGIGKREYRFDKADIKAVNVFIDDGESSHTIFYWGEMDLEVADQVFRFRTNQGTKELKDMQKILIAWKTEGQEQ